MFRSTTDHRPGGAQASPAARARWLLRGLALLLLPWGLSSCSSAGQVFGEAAAPLPLPPGITVAFNQRSEATYRSPISGERRRGDDLEALLLQAIRGARREVLVAVQELSLPAVAEALVERHRRGVRVQVVLENSYSTPWSEQHDAELSPHLRTRRHQLMALADRDRNGQLSEAERSRGDAVLILRRAGVPVIDDREDGSAGSGLMHSKYLVLDQAVVITGSTNFTPSCVHGDPDDARTRGNVNHLLRFESPALAARFRDDFTRMWGDGPGGRADSRFGQAKGSGPAQTVVVGNTPVQVLFAPHRRNDPHHGLNLLAHQLSQARRRLDMALFVFSAQQLTDVLAELQRRRVKIRLLADAGFASRSFSEVLDLLGVSLADRLCKLEAANQPLSAALEGVGIARLPGGDKLHHKVAVIDNRTVITGSFNWSPSAAHQNDEVLLVIHSPLLAAHFTREIDRLWKGAELGITDRLARKLQQGRLRCGSGVERGS
jgi:phosphatidylserine/phosphatidylglycerophosphate/cardiolipin synthase-like enzyme